ncbi:MAG: helix-turn-helix domain-containing protein [Microbacterium enclense]
MSDFESDDRLDDVLRALADRVRDLRRGRQLSISDLSFESGLSEARLRGVEAGRSTASLATLVALAETFEISLADLFRDASATQAADERVEPSSPYVVPSEVVWGGELPPAPWAHVDVAEVAAEIPAAATSPSESARAVGARTFAPTEKVWGGPLPPAPWMPQTPPIVEHVAPSPAPNAVSSPTRVDTAVPAAGRGVPATPAAHREQTAAVARAHDYALSHGMRENSAYVFVAPGGATTPVPRTFADLRTGALAGRAFRSLQEFAVASIVEGGFALTDVARVFRIPAWRLEKWVVETGHVAR